MNDENKNVSVTILGSGTCVPSLERSSCSVLVQGDGLSFLLDAGPGTMRQLLRAGVMISEIDALFLSHFHPDHASEMPGFLFSTKYPEFIRDKPLTLAGGTGVLELFDNLNRAFDSNLTLPEEIFEIMSLELPCPAPLIWDRCCITWGGVSHRPESRAFRFSFGDGTSIVYSGDTDYSEELVDFAMGADLFICESALPDGEKVAGHLTPSLAGEIAARAGVGRLVLTHFYPACDQVDLKAQCRQKYAGPLDLAHDLMVVYMKHSTRH